MFEKHDAVEDLLETVLQLPVGVSQHSSSTVLSNPARLTAHAFRSRDGHTEAIQRQALIGSLKWCFVVLVVRQKTWRAHAGHVSQTRSAEDQPVVGREEHE
jgi:hypothetical protein